MGSEMCIRDSVNRQRGGRVRSNEEMRGSALQSRLLDASNFAIPSSAAEMESVRAFRAKIFRLDGSSCVAQNTYASTPGRALCLVVNTKRMASTTPPSLGSMNAYGGEGPKFSACSGYQRVAATTPPSLGSMNPYGGEGPPQGCSAKHTFWWDSFRAL